MDPLIIIGILMTLLIFYLLYLTFRSTGKNSGGGKTGPTGPVGPTGPSGKPGKSIKSFDVAPNEKDFIVTYTDGTTQVLSNAIPRGVKQIGIDGDNLVVQYSGSEPFIHNVETFDNTVVIPLPEGPTGPKGQTGKVGPMGPTGPTGSDGNQGPRGRGIQSIDREGTTIVITYDDGSSPTVLKNAFRSIKRIYLVDDNTLRIEYTDGSAPDDFLLPKGEVGPTGPTGPQGPRGSSGPRGLPGARGATGAQGIRGNTGARGATGARGSSGPRGLPGARGATGAQGIKGNTGARGATGAQGIRGNTGARGLPGARGATGAQGIRGETGPRGSSGARGLPGERGPTGAQGIRGNTGARGVTGPRGSSGAQGQQGPRGIQGSTGPMGATGSGIKNIYSKDGNLIIEYFKEAVVPLPPGPTGPPGPKGKDGSQGPAGKSGILSGGGSISRVYNNIKEQNDVNSGMMNITGSSEQGYNRVLTFSDVDYYNNSGCCDWFSKIVQENNIIQIQDSKFNLYYYLVVGQSVSGIQPVTCYDKVTTGGNIKLLNIKAISLANDDITTGEKFAQKGIVTASVVKNKIFFENIRNEENNPYPNMFYDRDTREISYGKPFELCIGGTCVDETDLKNVKKLKSGFQLRSGKTDDQKLCFRRGGAFGESAVDMRFGECGQANYTQKNLYFV